MPFLGAFTMPPRAPADIVASIKANYFSLIAAKYIVIRHPEVSKTTVYLLLKNPKEHRAAYPVLYICRASSIWQTSIDYTCHRR